MLSVAEASREILAHIQRLDAEQVDLAESFDRVLAENIVSPISVPPWNNSSMDGFAVCSADLASASEKNSINLPIGGDIPAGSFASRPLQRGECMRIMTGAPVPDGADSVVRVEDVIVAGNIASFSAPAETGKNIRLAGEDFRAGETIISEGSALSAPHIGVLASAGKAGVKVFRRPRVALISSGDELASIESFDEVKRGKKIISSNSYTLPALIRESGGIPVDLGIAADSVVSLREKLEQARDADFIITTAGVSVGDRDYTRDVFAELGGKQIFWRVRMRPGAPLAFGLLGGKPWLGLSGNPVSAIVTFLLFARPVIRKMLGHSLLFPQTLDVRAAEEITTSAKLTHFLRGIIQRESDGTYSARLSGSQSSAVLTSLARANALLVIPETQQRVAKGASLKAIPLSDGLMSATLDL